MGVSIDQIVDAQVHLGSLKRESHPKTNTAWIDIINGMVVFNPDVIAQQLENAKNKIQKAKSEGKNILIVCEKKMYADELGKIAEKAGVSYLNYKVPGGFLTNFDTLKKRISSMNEMASFLETDEYLTLTKKEQLVYKRTLAKVEKIYKGVKNLSGKPELVIVIDGTMMNNLIDELKNNNIDNIIISSSNFSRWRDENSLIFANIGSYKSIDFVVKYILS